MSSSDESPMPPKASADDLLEELESIKDLLEDSDVVDDLDIDIPILDDVVANGDASEEQLLDITTIFDDKDDDNQPLLNLDDLDTRVTIPTFKLIATANADTSVTQTSAELLPAEPRAIENSSTSPGTITSVTKGTDEINDNEPDRLSRTPETASDQRPVPSTTGNAVDVDLLIQEVVDEFIPAIESELRQRLSNCTLEVLQKLADQHLKS